jgi:hypothetical protein
MSVVLFQLWLEILINGFIEYRKKQEMVQHLENMKNSLYSRNSASSKGGLVTKAMWSKCWKKYLKKSLIEDITEIPRKNELARSEDKVIH